MSPFRTEILATLLEILSDVSPPRTKILARPLVSINFCPSPLEQILAARLTVIISNSFEYLVNNQIVNSLYLKNNKIIISIISNLCWDKWLLWATGVKGLIDPALLNDIICFNKLWSNPPFSLLYIDRIIVLKLALIGVNWLINNIDLGFPICSYTRTRSVCDYYCNRSIIWTTKTCLPVISTMLAF